MASGQIVDVHTLAQFWGVDIRTIQNYANTEYEQPPLPREDRGQYDFVKAMKWMYDRQKKKIEILETSGDEKLHHLKIKQQLIKNKKEAIALKKELRQLIPRKGVLMVYANQFVTIKNSIGNLRYDLVRELELNEEQKKIIDKEFDRSLNYIAGLDIGKFLDDEDKMMEDEPVKDEVEESEQDEL